MSYQSFWCGKSDRHSNQQIRHNCGRAHSGLWGTSFSIKEYEAGEYLFTSYYSLPSLAALLSTSRYLFCNCALLYWSDKGMMKQGHRHSCKHLDVISACVIFAVLSQCLMCVCACVCVGVGGGGCKPPTADEPQPSRQQLKRTDSMESLQLFSARPQRGAFNWMWMWVAQAFNLASAGDTHHGWGGAGGVGASCGGGGLKGKTAPASS